MAKNGLKCCQQTSNKPARIEIIEEKQTSGFLPLNLPINRILLPYHTWIRCDICGAIIFDKEGPREFARPDQAERCKGACEGEQGMIIKIGAVSVGCQSGGTITEMVEIPRAQLEALVELGNLTQSALEHINNPLIAMHLRAALRAAGLHTGK